MTLQNLADIKDKNGLPSFINNLNTVHYLKLMDEVYLSVKTEDDLYWLNQHPEFKLHHESGKPFYIVNHTRDCDGTPLYGITNTDREKAIALCKICRMTGLSYHKYFDQLFNINLVNKDDKFENIDGVYKFIDMQNKYLLNNLSKEAFII